MKRDSAKEVKRAVVMGATSGIGMEVALLLAKKGWRVGIAGRREELLNTIICSLLTTLANTFHSHNNRVVSICNILQ